MEDFTSMSFFSSYGNLKPVNGYTTTTFHEACKLIHFLEDYTEWDNVLSEASTFLMPRELCGLYATICSHCEPENEWRKVAKI